MIVFASFFFFFHNKLNNNMINKTGNMSQYFKSFVGYEFFTLFYVLIFQP